MITVILSGYKRTHALKQQYEAIKNQTVDEVDIWLWTNSPDGEMQDFPKDVVQNCESTMSNSNYGVWGRFALALNASTKYVNIIDDDTIPGRKWLENCLMTMESHRGPLGTRGIIMNPEDDRNYPYNGYETHGWGNPNEEVERVDMLCHSWFFEADWLRFFWAEAPIPAPHHFGEDMHLSYAVKRHLGLHSYVPPHPINDREMWGSQPETGHSIGEDEHAISKNNVNNQGMNKYWNYIRDRGYSLMKEEL
tara:strand:- start:983 stop:1732 length:750 start_codon:yes stop_codon:yes gene_type:complete